MSLVRLTVAALLVPLALLLAGNPGFVRGIGADGALLLPEEEHPSAGIELQVLAMHLDWADGEAWATWGVGYRFSNEGRAVEQQVRFPIDVLLLASSGHWSELGRSLASELRGMIRVVDSAHPLQVDLVPQDETQAAIWEFRGFVDHFYYHLQSGALELEEPLRLPARPEQLSALGVTDLEILVDGKRVEVEGLLAELRSIPVQRLGPSEDWLWTRTSPPHDTDSEGVWRPEQPGLVSPEAWALDQFWRAEAATRLAPGRDPEKARAVELRLQLLFGLPLAAGGSEVLIRYRSPVLSSGGWSVEEYSTSYELGPGGSWKGPIGTFALAVEDGALQGQVSPKMPVPFGPAASWEGMRLWTLSDVEPTGRDRVVISGAATQLFEPADASAPYLPGRDSPLLPGEEPSKAHRTWGSWLVPVGPSLPIGSPWASEELEAANLFLHGFGPIDLSFVAGHVADGESATAWCADAAGALPWVEFELGQPASALWLTVGNHKPWPAVACADGEEPLVYHRIERWTGEHEEECLREWPGELLADFAAPRRLALTDADGRRTEVVVVDALDRLLVDGPFPAGPLRVDVLELRPGQGEHTDHVCVSEIEPVTVLADELEALLQAVEAHTGRRGR